MMGGERKREKQGAALPFFSEVFCCIVMSKAECVMTALTDGNSKIINLYSCKQA